MGEPAVDPGRVGLETGNHGVGNVLFEALTNLPFALEGLLPNIAPA
jgi:hypothetical protein